MKLVYVTKYSLAEPNKALDRANRVDLRYEDSTFTQARQRMLAINHKRWIIVNYTITLVIRSASDSK